MIPLVVLEEIDKNKSRRDDAGRSARAANRALDNLRKKGDLSAGVGLPSGGSVRIIKSKFNGFNMPMELTKESVDNMIISMVKDMQSEMDTPVILITKDISMRVKCDTLGVKCEDYLKHNVVRDTTHVYGGLCVIKTHADNVDLCFKQKKIDLSLIEKDDESEFTLLPNEFVVLKNGGSQSALCRYDARKKQLQLITEYKDGIWGLKPRNKEQKFALDILLNKDVKLVSLIGPAGTGKTLLATAAGLKQVLEDQQFSKLIVSRPIQPVGRDIGFLPGTKEEKMEPWVQPIMDNLQYLCGRSGKGPNIDMYFEQGLIEVEAITYIRGRSIPNTYMIIDECQNLTPDDVKTIITRVGEGTKIVLTGDIDQIDNGLIDSVSNGLTYAVERFKKHDIAGHISMVKGERSDLATLAASIM